MNIKYSNQLPYIPRFSTVNKFFSFLQTKIASKLLCETWFFKYMLLKIEILFIPLLTNSHIFEISEDDHPRLVTHARDHWWTLDFANASLSPGVNSRAELVPSPRANARNGAPRRWLGDYIPVRLWTNFKASKHLVND